jgi:hypothetical protein
MGSASEQTSDGNLLLLRIDWALVFGFHAISLSPLPIVVAVIVDLFDCDRCLRWNIIREIFRPLCGLVSL